MIGGALFWNVLFFFFSHERPCWDEETLTLAGEAPHALGELLKSGDLMRIAAGYGLTPQGVRTRERVSRELCVPVSSAGEVLVDEVRAGTALERNRAQKVRGRTEDLLPLIGRLHVFLMEQRRIYVPGWFDIDREEQENWVLLALATDTEAQLASLTATLRAWGHDLIDPANPLYIVGTSIERLRAQREQKRTLYDWFQEETVRILRPDAPDGE